MSKTFNMEMNIAKAIGILAIVAGHTIQIFNGGGRACFVFISVAVYLNQ